MTTPRPQQTQTRRAETARPEQGPGNLLPQPRDAKGRAENGIQHDDDNVLMPDGPDPWELPLLESNNVTNPAGQEASGGRARAGGECGEIDDFPRLAPDRPVDARWRIIRRAARAGRFSPRLEDDGWVALGLRYMRRLRACRGDADREELARAAPDLDGAYRLHKDGDNLQRGLFEALILARQSDELIAAGYHVTPLFVRTYEAMFFSVRDRLHLGQFIHKQVVGAPAWMELDERDADVVLRRLGYVHGREALPAMTRYYTSAYRIPRTLAGLSRAEVGELAEMLCMRGIVVKWTQPANRKKLSSSLGMMIKFMKGYFQHLSEEEGIVPRSATAPAPGTQAWLETWPELLRRTSGRLTGPTTLRKGRTSRRGATAAGLL